VSPSIGKLANLRRLPVAAVLSALVALCVYRVAVTIHTAPPPTVTERLAALDTDTVLALRDIAHALVPAEDPLSQASADDDAGMLAALPVADLLDANGAPEPPSTTDLSPADIEQVAELIGASS